MALVDYSSSEEEPATRLPTNPSSSRSLKRKRSGRDNDREKSSNNRTEVLPALPSSFRDLYASAARVSTQDDPSLHGGRTRTVPHVEGNWPAHVYLEWYPSSTECQMLTRCLADVERVAPDLDADPTRPELQSLLFSDLGAQLPLHISLSAPLVLKTDQRNDYLEAITAAVDRSVHGSGGFAVRFAGIDWALNDTVTRRFLALRIAKPAGNELNCLLEACNDVSDTMGLPTLYRAPHSYPQDAAERRGRTAGPREARANCGDVSEDGQIDHTDRFHFSIAWSLHSPTATTTDSTMKVAAGLSEQVLKQIRDLCVEFNEVKVKIGKDVTPVPLSRRKKDAAGVLA